MPDRIIMALWKQKGEMIEKEPEPKELPCEEGSLLANEDVKMSEVYSAALSVDVSFALLKMNACVNLYNSLVKESV
jgi:hypothetical protein